MSLQTLAVGLLAVSKKQTECLTELLSLQSITPACVVTLNEGDDFQDKLVDVWVANLDGADNHARHRDLLEHFPLHDEPVMYIDDMQLDAAHGVTIDDTGLSEQDTKALKAKRLMSKLLAVVTPEPVETKLTAKHRKKADKVWVLAASTGGPDAVAAFLHELPDELPGVALIYVQHIEQNALATLKRVVSRNCNWDVQFVDKAHLIQESTIYIVSPEHQIEISDVGVLSPLNEPWKGFYKPSASQVMAKVVRSFKHNSGAIIFSGMGDDGADSCQLFHHRGGAIWAQDGKTCTIDSMPESASKTGCVSLTAEPGQLALALIKHHMEEQTVPVEAASLLEPETGAAAHDAQGSAEANIVALKKP